MITEKDFQQNFESNIKIHFDGTTTETTGYTVKAGKECFELAKQLAVDFRKWYIIQEREGNNHIYGKTPEQLLDLYFNKK